MHSSLSSPPFSPVETVTEVLHGVEVVDPYRWLEDQESPRTRRWLEEQTAFAREYLDSIPGRDRIRERIREFLEVETLDSLLIADGRYVFRKRLPYEEQHSIYFRERAEGADVLLVDPRTRGSNIFCAVKPLALSPDASVLAYEVKEGGERASRIELLDVSSRARLLEVIPRGLLRGFAFATDSKSFFYSQDSPDEAETRQAAVYQHRLGTPVEEDVLIFSSGEQKNVRLGVLAGSRFLLILIHHVAGCSTDCYLQPLDFCSPARLILTSPRLLAPEIIDDRIFVLTNQDAPNYRIAEVRLSDAGNAEVIELVPTGSAMIQQWMILRSAILVLYWENGAFWLNVFDFSGRCRREIHFDENATIRLVAADRRRDEVLFQSESFFSSPAIQRYSVTTNRRTTFVAQATALSSQCYTYRRVSYPSKDGTTIPMYLVGDRRVLEEKGNPLILTSYGGFRHVMTPQFSVFVSFLMEQGCVFALPSIRGGGDFGSEWHVAGKGRFRQTAFDDFIAAAQWLLDRGISKENKIAIFGGSNSGLLVGAALTQAPHLFRAAIVNAPLLDMVRYHLFNGAIKWREEFGCADDPEDFATLFGYSPYHCVRDNTEYPAVLMISGDSDQNCNPLHARKMVARLQAANSSSRPIILDYSVYRGHVAVLPLSIRVNALTDRMAFVCDQLDLLE